MTKFWSGVKKCKSFRSRQELSNENLVAKFGFDTTENEPEYGYGISLIFVSLIFNPEDVRVEIRHRAVVGLASLHGSEPASDRAVLILHVESLVVKQRRHHPLEERREDDVHHRKFLCLF